MPMGLLVMFQIFNFPRSRALLEHEAAHLASDKSLSCLSGANLTIDRASFTHANTTISMKSNSKVVMHKGNVVAIDSEENAIVFDK